MKFSAPAKIHLLGEHTVVHGKPALLTAINLRLSVEIKKFNKTQLLSEEEKLLQQTVEKVIREKFPKIKIPKYNFYIESKIPIGSGLGSSAASASAFIASLFSFLKIKFDRDLINELTYETEKVFHGNPSGADNTTIVHGGFIWFRKEFEFLKNFSTLPFSIHQNIKDFILIDSGKPVENTKEMVAKVQSKLNKNYQEITTIFNHQELLTKDIVTALKEGNTDLLQKTIFVGQKNLEKLGVAGKTAQNIIRQVESLGGAAKILGGAGFEKGSGLLLAYPKDLQKLLTLIKQNNWDYLKIKLGEKGLRKES